MPFCSLMGVTVPVLASSGTVEYVHAGEYGRTMGNVPFSTTREEAPEYAGSLVWSEVATAQAYRLLMRGAGHAWRFNGDGTGASAAYYSSKGLAPATATGTTVQSFTGGGPVASGPRLLLSGDAQLFYEPGESPLGLYTMSLWLRSADTGNAWRHVVAEYASGAVATVWVNGVVTALVSVPNLAHGWFAPATALFEIDAIGVQVELAELMILPYRLSLLESGWAVWAYNAGAGRAAEELRYLSMSGDWCDAGSDSVLGEATNLKRYTVGADSYVASFDFTLRSRNTED